MPKTCTGASQHCCSSIAAANYVERRCDDGHKIGDCCWKPGGCHVCPTIRMGDENIPIVFIVMYRKRGARDTLSLSLMTWISKTLTLLSGNRDSLTSMSSSFKAAPG